MLRDVSRHWFSALNPAPMQDGEFSLGESGAILRYLCDTRSVADHWYPREAAGSLHACKNSRLCCRSCATCATRAQLTTGTHVSLDRVEGASKFNFGFDSA